MASFASTTDLATFLQGPVNDPSAQLALDIATARIQAETGQNLSYVADDVITLRGASGRVLLPESPVIDVTSVITRWIGESETTTRIVDVDYVRWGNELSWAAGGYVRVGASPKWNTYGWDWPEYVTVTYSHGYATIPDDIRGTCLLLAAEMYSSPDGIGYESIDDYAWRRTDSDKTPAAHALESLIKRYGCRTAMIRVGR